MEFARLELMLSVFAHTLLLSGIRWKFYLFLKYNLCYKQKMT